MAALLLLIAVTAVWGVTFVQVKDALELYPLFAFLGVRFAIAGGVLAVPARSRVRSLGRKARSPAWSSASCSRRRTASRPRGLERTTVSGKNML